MKTLRVGSHHILVDDNNFDRIKGLRLNATRGVVNVTWCINGNIGCMPLSKVVIQTDAIIVDHKDRNWLNFQVSNLRPCTRSQNQGNQKKHGPHNGRIPTSKYRGVSKYNCHGVWRGKWSAQCSKQYIGHYDSEEDAARAYDEFAANKWGEFANLNFP